MYLGHEHFEDTLDPDYPEKLYSYLFLHEEKICHSAWTLIPPDLWFKDRMIPAIESKKKDLL